MSWLTKLLVSVISALFAEIISQKRAKDQDEALREIKDLQDANNVKVRDLASVIDKLRRNGNDAGAR